MKITFSEKPHILTQALEKRKKTCMEKYNVDNITKIKATQKKADETRLKKYGYKRFFQNKKIQEQAEQNAHTNQAYSKRKETCLKKYGVDHHMKNEESKKKGFNTYENKTGYSHPMKNPETLKNIQDKYGKIGSVLGYSYNGLHFDSSWELAFYIWLTDNNKQFIFHPENYIEYIGDDGLLHNYYPDFLVEGIFYEIKGNQFFNEKEEPYNMYTQKYWWTKYNLIKKHKIVILREKDMKFYLEYIKKQYGKTYLKEFRNKKKGVISL